VFKLLCTGVAFIAVFGFYRRMKTYLEPHKVFMKFLAFKSIIGLNALQTV